MSVKRFFKISFFTLFSLGLLGGFVLLILALRLPSVDTLKNVQLQVPLRIYTFDKKLIAEYGEKRRIPVSIDDVPPMLIQAILATEDQRFFEHPGVDIFGLMRATVELIRTGEKSQGGSTITMQVARNFFLSRKKTFMRKINEILLAIKIDATFSKKKILELYLNKIYLGYRAYGVAAAAQVYYGKRLGELTLPQMAMIAGLPKAPSRLNPLNNKKRALARRNHVLDRMHVANLIDKKTLEEATEAPLTASYHGRRLTIKAPYVAEMIRQSLVKNYGESVYTKGYQVYTTINSAWQKAANRALIKALHNYDQRHGYRGPLKHIDESLMEQGADILQEIPRYGKLIPALITGIEGREASIVTRDRKMGIIQWSGMRWARPALTHGYVGRAPKQASDIMQAGDIVYVMPRKNTSYRLAQIPQVEGALIALNPKDGAIRSLVGGYNFYKSKYNRITQAERQPGSAFKPFIYSAALAQGYTLASEINDAPVVRNDPSLENQWRPENDNRTFVGPTRLREGLVHSRNLVSVRLLESIGIPYTLDYVQRFGFNTDKLPDTLSLALGSGAISPLALTQGYAIFANGGFRVEPYLIDHITDSLGHKILQAEPPVACGEDCSDNPFDDNYVPSNRRAERALDPQVAYLMNLLLRDVVKNGTGRAAKVLKRKDIGGKTGTTNDHVDAWFAGFNCEVVTTTWVGFDKPQNLHEYGSQVALPMWIDFMHTALRSLDVKYLAEPEGLVTVRIDKRTGLLPSPGQQKNTAFETFRKTFVPKQHAETTNTQSVSEDNSNRGDYEELF